MIESENIFNSQNKQDESIITEDINSIFNDNDSKLGNELDFWDDFQEEDFKNDTTEKLDSTQKISLYSDEKFQEAINKLEKFDEDVIDIDNDKLEIKEDFRTQLRKTNTFEAAFINCSILGFVVLFMGFGWFVWIIDKIAF